MSRLRRFPDNRYIGHRDEMIVYDCDIEEQFAVLKKNVENDDLDLLNLLQAFAPDTLAEASNRRFRPV